MYLAGHCCIESDVVFDKIASLMLPCLKVIYKSFPLLLVSA